ncbi:MAG TPA: rRNA pseudouridine synthase [Candidatus Ornithomonoglobus intestinigallinarum]|uniref:Pseudouridine synthase n=1 Tax=Candidatus Ornithomonoglobus intestinigallinarum TaxID=2840894 RepID=A0A9D1KPY9_9FIRM|nr:rRNA pseudouridine synthase [Candidatus Ornithomonoglobus intestinigallinarum]
MGEIVRLQKYIAMSGAASRRAAEQLISEGRVTVNGEKITEQGVKVEIGADKVALDGEQLKVKNKKYYIMLNKPEGYVTTVNDQFDRPTVIDLIKTDLKDVRLFPVGRLDYDTEGLLLLTNDGDFTYRVTHPKFNTDKTYIALLKGGISVKGLNMLRSGVKIDDYKTSPAEVEIIDAAEGYVTARITIHEGRNRQVRKMFEAVGSKVVGLRRIKIGKVELGTLPLGRWRYLTSHEINYLMNK